MKPNIVVPHGPLRCKTLDTKLASGAAYIRVDGKAGEPAREIPILAASRVPCLHVFASVPKFKLLEHPIVV
jgi:hypothetical protein